MDSISLTLVSHVPMSMCDDIANSDDRPRSVDNIDKTRGPTELFIGTLSYRLFCPWFGSSPTADVLRQYPQTGIPSQYAP